MNSAKLVLTLSLLINFLMVFSQKELQITYNVNNGEVPKSFEIESELRANKFSVLYLESMSNEFVNGATGEVLFTETKIFTQNYKSLRSNTLWSMYDEAYIVKEDLNLFKWKFEKEQDTVLNYSCRLAKTVYQGREYTAWFTTDIPFKAAPWKISGLPGVVLKLKSTDNFYSLEAKSLSIIESQSEIEMPFKDNKTMKWEEYVLKYKEDIEAKEKKLKAVGIQYGKSYNDSYPKIEVLIEKNRNASKVYKIETKM